MHLSSAAGASTIFSHPSGSRIINSRRSPASRARASLIRPMRCFDEILKNRRTKNPRTQEPKECMMSRRVTAVVPVLVLWFFGSLIFMTPTADAAEKVLRHIVMYKFKDDVKPAQIQEVIDAFA